MATYVLEMALIVTPEGETWHIGRVDEPLSLLVVVKLVLCKLHELVSTVCHIY